jgi:hypothetical protein
MNKNTSEIDNTIIKSDKYLRESGAEGGKIIGEHIVLGSFIIGIAFFIVGLCVLFGILFGFFSTNTAVIIGALLVTVMGLLLIIGGYSIYREKHIRN